MHNYCEIVSCGFVEVVIGQEIKIFSCGVFEFVIGQEKEIAKQLSSVCVCMIFYDRESVRLKRISISF